MSLQESVPSTTTQELQQTEVKTVLTYTEALVVASEKYLELCKNVQEKFKHHHDLAGAFEAGIRNFQERMQENNDQIVYNMCDNFLYCLEEVKDGNVDFFLYQVDKIKKKSGKVEKQKVSRLIGKAPMKVILKESNEKMREYIFTQLVSIFKLFTTTNDNGDMVFFPEFVEFVKKNLNDSKFYSKMLVSIDYAESILDDAAPALNFDETNVSFSSESDSDDDKKSNSKSSKKDKKKSNSDGNPFEQQFMKGLENTKIAQLAKSISDKINPDEFPMLNDPSQLLSSLSNPEQGGLGNLLNFVMTNVQEAMQQNNFDEKELINETSGLLGGLTKMTGMDPMSMFQNMAQGMQGAGENGTNGQPPMPDLSQFAGIFENLNQTLGESMKNVVEEKNQQQSNTQTKKTNKKK